MNFVIITHVQHIKENSKYYGYAPYVREMNIWLKYVNEVTVVAPIEKSKLDNIHLDYHHKNIKFKEVPNFNTTSFLNLLRTLFKLPFIVWTIFLAMKRADHIHLRCPGNMGLLGCLVQILFPNTPKTAKYAGNWDPKAKQPITYKIQKWILNNTTLTKNMQVLVYGEWAGSSKNIKSFFTATYSEIKKESILPRSLKQKINFVFVGTLSIGKKPLYAIQLVENLKKMGVDVQLDLFGDGVLRTELKEYIELNQLKNFIFLKGNQSKESIEQAYKESHFLILASKSEGWPKVVAEAMFWGCLPLTTNVSCVNYMIDNGNRGKLLNLNLQDDTQLVFDLIQNEDQYLKMCFRARDWSQHYTTDYFESEIVKLLAVS
jgi:glycosyltransferase involved in cell wall biosynthesis